MRVFLATGEASGDMMAAELARAIRALEPAATFSGIGGERMAAAGVELAERTAGWASVGFFGALQRVPPLLVSCWRHALRLRADPVDAVVVVDFGAYNLRLARLLRGLGYRRPIVYFFPPGAWYDRARQARDVAAHAAPLTPFRHQRDFYASLGLEAAWFGHPLVSLVAERPPRPPAPADGGTVGILPGSRRAELARHLPPLVAAAELVRARRPNVRFVAGAADAESEGRIVAALGGSGLPVTIVRGSRGVLDASDAAWVASGTAVLEAALRGVPAVALYVIAAGQVAIAKRLWRRPWVTLPNIVLDRMAVPELLQDDATPERLAGAIEAQLAAPGAQLASLRELRAALGPQDALARCAAFVLARARG